MSDSYLFQSSKNKWQLLVFGTSITDARQYAKNSHPAFDMVYVGKNSSVGNYTCCATTEDQVKINRESLSRMLEEN